MQFCTLCSLVYSNDLNTCGYEKVFEPLLNDLRVLESDGVFVESLSESVHGTLLWQTI